VGRLFGGWAVIDSLASLKTIAEQVAQCRLCKLGEAHARPVPGEGNPNAEVMMVGEAPGFYEDQQGRPFVGAAGGFLDQLLKEAGLARKDVYITNVIKHRPPGNRDPEPDEIEACDTYLRAQIAAVHPLVIVTLGRFSLAKFMPTARSMRDVHGRPITQNGMTICPMYHPAAALHQGSLRPVLEQDFRALPMIIARARERSAAATAGPAASVADEAQPEQLSLW
jgi:DNA polymerase